MTICRFSLESFLPLDTTENIRLFSNDFFACETISSGEAISRISTDALLCEDCEQ